MRGASRRIVAAVLFVVAAVASTAWCAAGSAWARGGLVDASPGNGAALRDAPREVDLTFSATPDPDQSHVAVRSDRGVPAERGAPRRAGDALRVPVSAGAAGNYTVAFHVEFTDGTDLVGEVRFSVGTGVPPPAAVPGADRAAAAVPGHDHGVDPMSAVLLCADVAVLVGVVLLLLRRDPRWTVRGSLDAESSTDRRDSRAADQAGT
jgi:methionine-rich copper-binding protein CopC